MSSSSYDALSILGVAFGALAIIFVIALMVGIFSIICNWRIFNKLGLRGWVCLIPFYSTIAQGMATGTTVIAAVSQCGLLAAMVGTAIGLPTALCTIASIISVVLSYVVQYRTITALSRPKAFIFLAIFAPLIYLPIMAFTDA